MNSSFSMSGGTSKEGSGPNDSTAAADAEADAASVGAADGASDGAAVGPPPLALHAARNAALADIVPAHMNPRRLSGVCAIWRTIRWISCSVTVSLLLPVDPGTTCLIQRG